jgi:hypothetical protein
MGNQVSGNNFCYGYKCPRLPRGRLYGQLNRNFQQQETGKIIQLLIKNKIL